MIPFLALFLVVGQATTQQMELQLGLPHWDEAIEANRAGQHELALKLMQDALKFADKYAEPSDRAAVRYFLGLQSLNVGDKAQAVTYLNEAVDLCARYSLSLDAKWMYEREAIRLLAEEDRQAALARCEQAIRQAFGTDEASPEALARQALEQPDDETTLLSMALSLAACLSDEPPWPRVLRAVQDLPTDPEDRFRLLASLAAACAAAWDEDGRREVLRARRDLAVEAELGRQSVWQATRDMAGAMQPAEAEATLVGLVHAMEGEAVTPIELFERARAATSEGDHDRAGVLFEMLETLADAEPDPQDRAELLFACHYGMRNLREFGHAIGLLRRAIEIAREHELDPEFEAKYQEELGDILLDSVDEPAEAAAAYLAAVPLYTAIPEQSARLLSVQERLALAQAAAGDYTGALDSVDRALELCEAQGQAEEVRSGILQTAGRIALDAHEPALSVAYLAQSVEGYRRAGDTGNDRLPSVLRDLGRAHEALGDWQAELPCYLEAAAIHDMMGQPSAASVALMDVCSWYESRGDLPRDQVYADLAATFANRDDPVAQATMGLVRWLQDQAPQEASAVRQRIINTSEQDGEPIVAGIQRLNWGNSLSRSGEFARAREVYERARLQLAEAQAPPILMLYADLGLAEALASLGDAEEARELVRRHLPEIQDSPDARGKAGSLTDVGEIAEACGDYAEAADYFQRALNILERLQYSFPSMEARRAFDASHARAANGLARCLARQGRIGDAFLEQERVRARLFLTMLAERDVELRLDAPPDLLAQLQRINDDLQACSESLIATEEQGQDAEPVQLRLAMLHELRARVTDELRRVSPRYAALRLREPVDLDTAARAVGPGTLIVSYSVGPSTTNIICILTGPGGLQTRHTVVPVGDSLLEPAVDKLRRAILERDADRSLQEAATYLHRNLVAPLEPLLSDAASVLLLPDGPLHALPFQVLAGGPDEPPLGTRLPIRYAPSMTALAELARRGRPEAPNRLVAFGNPAYAAETGEPESRRAAERLTRLQRLPYSGVEAALAAHTYGADSEAILGLMATEGRVREVAPQAHILHIASHALTNSIAPLDSAILLSTQPGRGAADDGVLHAWEILDRVSLNGGMVTLSACGTGMGRPTAGEGLVGLTTAMFGAGAQTVLCSQWPVADESTAALMVRFYTHYRASESPDAALRGAMEEIRTGRLSDGSPLELPDPLKWRAEWSHPYYWAPFILVGEWRTWP